MTCGTTLCPSAPLPPPPPPTLSSKASAAQVVFVAVPRATRTMQRFVMGEKYFTLFRVKPKKKRKKTKQNKTKTGRWGKGKEEGKERNLSPASDAPTSPQPTSPKFNSTLCFSALKTSLLDIASDGGVVMYWIWPCPGAETDVNNDGDGGAAGMNSMRSQRFCLRAFNSGRKMSSRAG